MNYRIPYDVVGRLATDRFIRTAITYVFIYAITVVVAEARGLEVSPPTMALLAVVFVVMIVISFFKVRRTMAALSITLNDDTISMNVPGVLASEVRRDEVTRIEERPKQALVVHGPGKRAVGVPAMIGGYDEIRAALATWHPIEAAQPSRFNLRRMLTTIAALGGWAATYLFDDPRVVIPIGSLLVIALLASVVIVWRNKVVDIRHKRLMLWVLMPVFALVVRVIEVARR